MLRQCMTAVAVFMMVASTAAAQDAKTVLGNASRAMGIDNVTAVHYYGTAAAGNLGQNNNANQPWPMAAMNDYVRAIDFSQPASRATWANYGVPVTGGRATLVTGTPQTQQLILPANQAWAQQLEIWITPWGFVKGGLTNNATARNQTVSDIRTRGETPLHRAAAFGTETAVQLLLDAGATREARDVNGDTPLTWASWHLRPAPILRKLCDGSFGIHPQSHSTYDHGMGWGQMDPPNMGRPHLAK